MILCVYLLQGFEIKACLESLVSSLLWAYRFAPATTDFSQSVCIHNISNVK